MRHIGIEHECVLDRDRGNGSTLRPEPARGRQLIPIDPVEGRGDLGAANLDGDRLRCPS
jgi:hypothetical protein